MPNTTITISLEEYNKLIESRLKAEQYKNFLIDNSTNNKISKALEMIECTPYFKLVIDKNSIKEGEEKYE